MYLSNIKLNTSRTLFFLLITLWLNFYLVAFCETQTVTVNLFANETGSPQYNPITNLISKKLLANLNNNKNINLIDNTANNNNLNTNKIINGSLTKIGEVMYLNVQVNDIQTGKIIAAFSEKTDSTYDDIIAKLETITNKINLRLSENTPTQVTSIPENNLKEQGSDSNGKYGVAFNFGLTSQGIVLPAINIHYDSGNNIFSLRAVKVNEFVIFDRTTEDFWDLALMYGRSLKSDFGYLSASLGVSLVSGITRGRATGTAGSGFLAPTIYESLPYTTIGLPLHAEAFWTPSSIIGLGVQFYGNINDKKPYFGGGFALQFGNLK